MTTTISNPARCEIRAVIRFLQAKGNSGAEIHRQIREVYGPSIMSLSKVSKWCREFRKGRCNVHDEEKCGRPSVVTDDLAGRVEAKLHQDNGLTMNELATEFPEVSRTTLFKIVTNKRKSSPPPPHDMKSPRTWYACAFMDRFNREGEAFLSHIVVGAETWISYLDHQIADDSDSSESKKSRKSSTIERKVIATVFWDQKGALLVDFVDGETINIAQVYNEALLRLRRAIQNRRRGMLTSGVVLLHDNSAAHTAACTFETIQKFGWSILDYPGTNSHFQSDDFHLFRHLKKWLAEQRFESFQQLQTTVQNWLKSQSSSFYLEGVRELSEWYQQSFNRQP